MSSLFTYEISEHFLVDLVAYSLLAKVFSKPEYRERLVLRGSHLTRSIVPSSRCRHPNDLDFLFYTQEDIFTEQQARQAAVSIRDSASDEYKKAFDKIVKSLVKDISTMGHSFEIPYHHDYHADIIVNANVEINWKPIQPIQVLHNFPDEPYPSAKIVISVNCELRGIGVRGTLRELLDFAVDIGSGDPFVGSPIETGLNFLSIPTSLSFPAVSASVLCAFKLHSAIQSDKLRLKDIYDLVLLLPEMDPVQEFFKANLRLAFVSRGHEVSRLNRLLSGPYDHGIESQWEAFQMENYLKTEPFHQAISIIAGLLKSLL